MLGLKTRKHPSNRIHHLLAPIKLILFRFSAWGKSSLGWYIGCKLHLVINKVGELLGFQVTSANVDDRYPVSNLTKNIYGKLFGDR